MFLNFPFVCQNISACLKLNRPRLAIVYCSRRAEGAGGKNGLIGRISILNDDGIAACGLLGIFTTGKVLGSRSQVSCHSTKSTQMIAEQENNFWKDCEKHYSSIKLLKDTFE